MKNTEMGMGARSVIYLSVNLCVLCALCGEFHNGAPLSPAGVLYMLPPRVCEEFGAMEAVIGLEVHCQLATTSKIFASATCEFGKDPNTQVDPVSLGLPGSLPVLNQKAVTLAVKAALALDCDVHNRSKFDRKHYYYPDLPKGYQISQFDEPYCTGGGVTIDVDGEQRFIPLTRIHMEEDAGKLVHQDNGPFSEVDLNRAGTPLIEIVSEPDIRTPAEAYAYLVELKRTLKAVEVSDCEMQEGSLRCDANVSVRENADAEFGTKVEIKNLNSFRAVEAAIAFEIDNQIALHKAGRSGEIVQETKLWDPNAKVTRSMRGKEGAADYRYFPDPDLPPLDIAQETIDGLKAALPELPRVRQERFQKDYGFSGTLAAELTAETAISDYFEALVTKGCTPKLAANWTREEALRLAGERKLPLDEAAPIAMMADLIKLVDGNKVARVVAKGECDELFAKEQDVTAYFEAKGLIQEQDDSQLEAWCQEVIAANPKVVEDVKGGNAKAIGRLVGQVMKASQGKANPKAVNETLAKLID